MKLIDAENRSLVARGQGWGWVGEMGDLAFFFFFLMKASLFIYLFIFGCVGSLFLCEDFL